MENWLANVIKGNGILNEPGDYVEARITQSGIKVFKAGKNGGMDKYSATEYSNGTVVETKTTKRK